MPEDPTPDAKALLLLTAAAHHNDPDAPGAPAALLLRAIRAAELAPDVLESAERADLVHADAEHLVLEPPRTAAAVYGAAPLRDRQAAHRLLAALLDPDRDRLAHLLHVASATTEPNPDLARELAAAARGTAATGARRALGLRRAAALAPEPSACAALLAEAAEHALLAGRADWARRWTARARALPADPTARGTAARVHGLIALHDGPVADAHQSFLLAARLLSANSPDRATRCRLAAAEAAWALGDAAAFRDAVAPLADESGPGPGDAVAYGLGMRAVLRADLDGVVTGAALLRGVVNRAERADDIDQLLRAGAAALVVGDLAAAGRLNGRALAVARVAGPVTAVPRILEHLAYSELRSGHHLRARAHAEEGAVAACQTGQRNLMAHHHAILALVASLDDDATTVRGHADAAEATAAAHGLRQATTLTSWALARADLARGRPNEAAARLAPLLRPGAEHAHFALRMLTVPCFAEAAALSGTPEPARLPLAEFAVWAEFAVDPQAPAQLARCQALLAAAEARPPGEVEAAYATALARHPQPDNGFERARTLLAYGRWLRRSRRPARARDLLREAQVTFDRHGARVWSAHAAAELRATGAPPTSADPTGNLRELTPQQLRIARSVADGATNREIATHLSVSIRTVDHHLRNVFATLGVRSRVELARLVTRAEP
ncbi:LuxR C-terminal-related transcriptional regulator [Yinghuangia sp. YIM S09857]|uniref:LuxR C-terminal-related transcriptional regulator n=1 Tax=Yinghuangia sp. YIM S09857 TaxID=3436929 RepID=UPI003F536FAD